MGYISGPVNAGSRKIQQPIVFDPQVQPACAA